MPLFIFRHDPPRGFWWDEGIVDRDVLVLIEVDVPDTRESGRAPDRERRGDQWRRLVAAKR